MARSALITDIKRQDNSHLAELLFKDARIYQPSSNEMFGKVQKIPQTRENQVLSRQSKQMRQGT